MGNSVPKTIRHCWRSRSLRGKRSEARDACGSKWATGKPCSKAVNVDRRRRCHVLQVCLGQPAVARSSQAECAGCLRNRTLDALAPGVELAAGLVLQARPCHREGLVLLARMQGQLSATSLRLCAACFGWADVTVTRAEADANVAPARLSAYSPPGAPICPSGHCAGCSPQSIAKSAVPKPPSVRLCQLMSSRGGPIRSMPK